MANSRTWYTACDFALPDASTVSLEAKSILWALKSILKQEVMGDNVGPAGAPPEGAAWTCVGSSDSVTSNMSGTDLWVTSSETSDFDATKLVRANSGAHSWIVLQSPAALGPLYLTIDWLAPLDYQCSFILAKSLPTGGSTTARPTSTDECGYLSPATQQMFMDSNALVPGGRVHFTTDADGNFWFFVSADSFGTFSSAIAVQTLSNLRLSGDVWPAVLVIDFATAGVIKEGSGGFYRTTNSLSSIRGKSADGVAQLQGTALGYMVSGNSVAQDMNGNFYGDGKSDTFPVVAYFYTTSYKGIKGTFPDCYTLTPSIAQGARSPATGDVEGIVVGNTLVPLTAVPTL